MNGRQDQGVAASGGDAGDTARPTYDPLWRDRVEWANRLIMITLALTPMGAVAFIWMFHDVVSDRVLIWWSALMLAIVTFSMAMTVRRRRTLHRGARPMSVAWQYVAIGLTGGVFSLPPWILPEDAEPVRRTLALLFPILALGVSVVVFASVRRWFIPNQIMVAASIVAWTVRQGDPYYPAFTAVLIGFVGLTLLLHREMYRLVLRSITLNARNGALLAALRHDQANVEHTNELLGDANRRLQHQAGHDSLTGVLNRRGLEERMDRFFAHARMADRHVMVLFCDLDRFKVVNDSLGHAAGDRLLTTTAERISIALPDTALLARLGGDEFVAVVSFPYSETDPSSAAVLLADRVREKVAEPVDFEGREFAVTTTVGVAMVPRGGAVSLDVLRQADRALHYAKDAGRNRVEVFGERLRHELPRRVEEEHTVRVAIERGDIVPWYQPIVNATTGHIIGAELLARWISADGEMMRASEFIGTVADTGLLEQLTEMLIERGVADLAEWEADGLPDGFRLGLNLPPRFVSRSGRVERLMALLDQAPRHRVTAEISERSVVDDLGVAASRLRELRSMGMLVTLDDFGTGAASLSLLQRMPLDGVKIDRSFVTAVADDPRDRALVAGFVRLTGELGLTVTAEGVETAAQASTLIDLGCLFHQGYLFGDAVDATHLRARLARIPLTPHPAF